MARAKVVTQARGHIKKDDFVTIIAGKDRGKQGKVLRVFPQEGRLTVERVNMIKRHTRPTRQMQQGGIWRVGRVCRLIMLTRSKIGRAHV